MTTKATRAETTATTMAASDPSAPIRRILVAIDASVQSLAALDAAAELAARQEAELACLFVEDINLLYLSALPFAHEVRLRTPRVRPLDAAAMERQLKAQGERIRAAVADRARRHALRWSFQVTRGRVVSEVLAVAGEADLLILGRSGSPLGRRRTLGSTARLLARRAPRSVLLVSPGTDLRAPVLVYYDASPAAGRALETACALAAHDGHRVTVLIPGDTPDDYERRRQAASERLAALGLRGHYRPLLGQLADLEEVAAEERGRVLVLTRGHPPLDEEALLALLDRLQCPVVLVREHPAAEPRPDRDDEAPR